MHARIHLMLGTIWLNSVALLSNVPCLAHICTPQATFTDRL